MLRHTDPSPPAFPGRTQSPLGDLIIFAWRLSVIRYRACFCSPGRSNYVRSDNCFCPHGKLSLKCGYVQSVSPQSYESTAWQADFSHFHFASIRWVMSRKAFLLLCWALASLFAVRYVQLTPVVLFVAVTEKTQWWHPLSYSPRCCTWVVVECWVGYVATSRARLTQHCSGNDFVKTGWTWRYQLRMFLCSSQDCLIQSDTVKVKRLPLYCMWFLYVLFTCCFFPQTQIFSSVIVNLIYSRWFYVSVFAGI